MKILQIDALVFKLPDGFKGDFSDGLRELARYYRKRKSIKAKNQPTGRITRKTWDSFLEVEQKGGRLCSIISIQSWNGKKWTKKKL